MEINVDHDVSRQIQARLADNPPSDLFVEAQDRVYQLLATGSYMKFSQSPLFNFPSAQTAGTRRHTYM